MVQVNYDATSCYDRIIPNLAMLVSRKNGVAESVAQMNAQTLEKSEYRIRTDQGIADTGYINGEGTPVFGAGQGSGNSPAIWCFVFSLLFDCYDDQAVGAQYCTPTGDKITHLNMVGFVDDSNGQTNCFQQKSTVDGVSISNCCPI